ncbi:MAG TPA: hypothetical protein VGH33_06850 [Isosphaeraceae bacterium]
MREVEALRAALAEATDGRDGALAERDRSRSEALAREADHRASLERWGREREDRDRESERLLAEERARALADRRRWAEQLDAARHESDRELAALRDRIEALGGEARDLAARLEAAEAARDEAERARRSEAERLGRALELARQSAVAAALRAEELIDQLRAAEEARDLAARETTGRGDRLEAELRSALDRIAGLNRDLALAHLSRDEAEPATPSPAEVSLAAAQRRIELLAQQLQAANRKNQVLVTSMHNMGISVG